VFNYKYCGFFANDWLLWIVDDGFYNGYKSIGSSLGQLAPIGLINNHKSKLSANGLIAAIHTKIVSSDRYSPDNRR
jgi:hypothetical protein